MTKKDLHINPRILILYHRGELSKPNMLFVQKVILEDEELEQISKGVEIYLNDKNQAKSIEDYLSIASDELNRTVLSRFISTNSSQEQHDFDKDAIYHSLVTDFYSLTLTAFRRLLKDNHHLDAEELQHQFWTEHIYSKPTDILKKMENSPKYVLYTVKSYLEKVQQQTINNYEEITLAVEENRITQESGNEECLSAIDYILYLLRSSKVNQSVFLYMLNGWSISEITKELGISQESVERRKSKIKSIIKQYIEMK